jgi:hypothetical protein
MTPEEEQALLEYIQMQQVQSDPTAAAFNDYGAGADYLDYAKKPTTFARQGDMHQIYRNMLGMTGLKLEDLVPGLYPVVEQPEARQPYQSDTVALYQNNPAYEAVKNLVDAGAPFEAALQSVTTEPELAKYVPVDNEGKLDLGGFRTSAGTYVTEGQKSARENAAYDAEQSAYQDYVGQRSSWSEAPGGNPEDVFRKTAPTASKAPVRPVQLPAPAQATGPLAPQKPGGVYSLVPTALGGPGFNPSRVAPGITDQGVGDPTNLVQLVTDKLYGRDTGGTLRDAIGTSNAAIRQNKVNVPQNAKYTRDQFEYDQAKIKDIQNKNSDKDYNAGVVKGAAAAKARRESIVLPSKEQENQRRLIAFYNQMIRQGG